MLDSPSEEEDRWSVDSLLEALANLWRESGAGADRAAADDVERSLSAGAHRARHALRTGLVAELYEQTLSRAPEEQELLKLEHFLSALERSGL